MKLKIRFFVLLSALMLAGCAALPAQPGSNSSASPPPALSIPASSLSPDNPEPADTSSAELPGRLQNALLEAEIKNVRIEYDAALPAEEHKSVRLSKELLEKIGAELAGPDRAQPIEKMRSITDYTQTIQITVTVNDGGDYISAELFRCGKSHPLYPDGAVLWLSASGEDGAHFLLDGPAFDAVYALLQDAVMDDIVELSGTYAKLACSWRENKEDPPYQGDFLQFGEKLLYRSASRNNEDFSVFDMVNAETGELLYSFEFSDRRVDRVETCDYEDYDYRIFSRSSVLYKKSGDPLAEYVFTLPDWIGIQLKTGYSYWQDNVFDVDLAADLAVFAGADGIYLSTLGAEKRETVLALENSLLSGVMEDNTHEFNYTDPHFLGDGDHLIALIESPGAQARFLGLSVLDLKTGKASHYTDIFSAMISEYRIAGNLVLAFGTEVSLIDPERPGEVQRILFGEPGQYMEVYTADGAHAVLSSSGRDEGGMPLVTIESASALSSAGPKELLTARGKQFYISGITEDYLLCGVRDSKDSFLAAVKYR